MASFTVGGKRISVTPQMVEDLLDGVAAGPVNKNFVVVSGRRFPPKQALSLIANIPLSEFISTEAIRVFRTLGFEVGRAQGASEQIKTEAELLLESYLQSHGLGHYKFEPSVPGTSKKPDYLLSFRGAEILLEVKQFDPTPDDFKMQGGAYDPYAPIREKINAGGKKFRDIKKTTCCLVLFNRGRPLVDLSWRFVYGAMLGRIAFRMPFDATKGEMLPEKATQGFFGGGAKMRHENGESIQAQNTTISAIVVIEQLFLGRRRFLADIRQREALQGTEFGLEESLAMVDAARGTERDWGLVQLRAVVCENPDAKNTLDPALFAGPFDERYGGIDDHIGRKYCGAEIEKLEAEEREARQSATSKERNWRDLPLKSRSSISVDDNSK